jgi:predicted HicB family RNase H-like nuclease
LHTAPTSESATRMPLVAPRARRTAPEPRRARPTGQAYVRMPVSLHQKLIESAEREGVSLNQYIVATLAAAERWSSR